MIETLMTRDEMWGLYNATAANHEKLMEGATPEQQKILGDNLIAMRLAVAAAAELMYRIKRQYDA